MTHESLVNGVILIVGGAMALAIWRNAKLQPLFKVRIVDGRPQVVVGTVTPAFLQRLRQAAASHELARGTIDGFAHGAVIRLKFSPEIPESCRQQLRNWWASFGWTPPRTRFADRAADR